jgi:hypothetical protein
MKSMKRLVLRLMIGGSLAASAIGIGAGVASAEKISEDGCIQWDSTRGCVVYQYCTLDTDARTWTCMTYDTRVNKVESESGAY